MTVDRKPGSHWLVSLAIKIDALKGRNAKMLAFDSLVLSQSAPAGVVMGFDRRDAMFVFKVGFEIFIGFGVENLALLLKY